MSCYPYYGYPYCGTYQQCPSYQINVCECPPSACSCKKPASCCGKTNCSCKKPASCCGKTNCNCKKPSCGCGKSNCDGLKCVAVNCPKNGDILKYQNGVWTNVTPPTPVSVSSVAYNSQYINQSPYVTGGPYPFNAYVHTIGSYAIVVVDSPAISISGLPAQGAEITISIPYGPIARTNGGTVLNINTTTAFGTCTALIYNGSSSASDSSSGIVSSTVTGANYVTCRLYLPVTANGNNITLHSVFTVNLN